jgi:hypothetical protein
VTVAGDPGRLSEAVSRCCGDLASFVWLAWAGLTATPKWMERVFFRVVELPSEVLKGCRGSVGKIVVMP